MGEKMARLTAIFAWHSVKVTRLQQRVSVLHQKCPLAREFTILYVALMVSRTTMNVKLIMLAWRWHQRVTAQNQLLALLSTILSAALMVSHMAVHVKLRVLASQISKLVHAWRRNRASV